MAVYSIARRTTGVGAGAAALEMIASANRRARIVELGIFLAAATASTYGIGRPAAAGITPTAPVLLLPEDPADPTAGVSTTALAWATGPTVPADFHRRIALPATIGTGVIWTFPKGIVLALNLTYVLWNIAANAVVDSHVVSDE